MQKVAIVTDSACDITEELQKKLNINILNFAITVDGKCYTERVDFTPQQYYGILRTAGSVPSTAHITMFQFLELYGSYEQQGYTDVILVTINATGSATNDAAQLALRQFKAENPESAINIHIIDSRTYSMGYGGPVCRAAEMIQEGRSVEQVVAYLKDIFSRVEILLTAYTLKYIKQSGRVSAAAAFAGDLLGLRPIISLIDGESIVRSKVRGDKQVLPALVNYAKEHKDGHTPYRIGTTDWENGERLAALCEKEMGYPPECVFYLGCAITTNTGPDAIAIVYQGPARG